MLAKMKYRLGLLWPLQLPPRVLNGARPCRRIAVEPCGALHFLFLRPGEHDGVRQRGEIFLCDLQGGRFRARSAGKRAKPRFIRNGEIAVQAGGFEVHGDGDARFHALDDLDGRASIDGIETADGNQQHIDGAEPVHAGNVAQIAQVHHRGTQRSGFRRAWRRPDRRDKRYAWQC